jgi:hypothetical protein
MKNPSDTDNSLIRKEIAALTLDRVRADEPDDYTGQPIFLTRPTFADLLAGGTTSELVARHAVCKDGVRIFDDAAHVERSDGTLVLSLSLQIKSIYEAATNPRTPSGGSSPSLGPTT